MSQGHLLKGTGMGISITAKAAEEALSLIEKDRAKESPELPEGELVLRVMVQGGGCSGFTYNMGFQSKDEVEETDIVEVIEGVTIVVDNKSNLYLDGVTIDFVDGLMGRGFIFDNPNATGTCGCGESFSV